MFYYLPKPYQVTTVPLGLVNADDLEGLDQVCDALLQTYPLKVQQLLGCIVVDLKGLILWWEVAALDVGAGQLILILGELATHNLDHFAVSKPSGGRK